jgi:hypothetical protein
MRVLDHYIMPDERIANKRTTRLPNLRMRRKR